MVQMGHSGVLMLSGPESRASKFLDIHLGIASLRSQRQGILLMCKEAPTCFLALGIRPRLLRKAEGESISSPLLSVHLRGVSVGPCILSANPFHWCQIARARDKKRRTNNLALTLVY